MFIDRNLLVANNFNDIANFNIYFPNGFAFGSITSINYFYSPYDFSLLDIIKEIAQLFNITDTCTIQYQNYIAGGTTYETSINFIKGSIENRISGSTTLPAYITYEASTKRIREIRFYTNNNINNIDEAKPARILYDKKGQITTFMFFNNGFITNPKPDFPSQIKYLDSRSITTHIFRTDGKLKDPIDGTACIKDYNNGNLFNKIYDTDLSAQMTFSQTVINEFP